MKLTVILPVYTKNNYALSLASLLRQSVEKRNYEIIVVINSSLTQSFFQEDNLRIFEVKWSGLDRARNFGVHQAKHDVIAFIDDDALADSRWIENIIKAHKQNEAPVIGGKVEPQWPQGGKPKWIKGILLAYLSILDYSSAPREVHYYDWLAGTNISFKKRIFSVVGMFNPGLDRKPGLLLSSGEEELCRRVRRAGYSVYYYPDIKVKHMIPPERMTPHYIIQRAYWQGISDFIMDKLELSPKALEEKTKKFYEKIIKKKSLGSKFKSQYKRAVFLCELSRFTGYLQAALREEFI